MVEERIKKEIKMKTKVCTESCLIQNICSELCDRAKEEIKKEWEKYGKLWLKEKGLTKKEMIRYEREMGWSDDEIKDILGDWKEYITDWMLNSTQDNLDYAYYVLEDSKPTKKKRRKKSGTGKKRKV